MLQRIKTRAAWLAIGLVFGGAALATAGQNTPVGDLSAPAPAPSVAEEATNEVDEARSPKAKEKDVTTAGERKQNHGFHVSKAARCEATGDGETTFEPPADCTGKAKGQYVSEVARSDIGKGPNSDE